MLHGPGVTALAERWGGAGPSHEAASGAPTPPDRADKAGPLRPRITMEEMGTFI